MKLLTLSEVYLKRGDETYKENGIVNLCVALGSFGFGGWIFSLYFNGDKGLFLALTAGVGSILFGLFFFYLFKRTISPDNWYVAVKPEGLLLIKFRSHLNASHPSSDKQVISLPFTEIDSVGITKQTEKSDSSDGTKYQFFTFLDIQVNSTNLEELAERLRYELNIKAKTRFRSYPVSLYDKTIRIEWRSSSLLISPGIGTIITSLERQGIRVLPKKKEKKDLRAQTVKNKKDKEAEIIHMVQKGDEIGAVRLTRELYGFDLTKAKKFVDELIDNPTSK